jgi:hypothetical protein
VPKWQVDEIDHVARAGSRSIEVAEDAAGQ